MIPSHAGDVTIDNDFRGEAFVFLPSAVAVVTRCITPDETKATTDPDIETNHMKISFTFLNIFRSTLYQKRVGCLLWMDEKCFLYACVRCQYNTFDTLKRCEGFYQTSTVRHRTVTKELNNSFRVLFLLEQQKFASSPKKNSRWGAF